MFVFWAVANILVAANSFINRVVLPIVLQPVLFCFMSLVCLAQCYAYPDRQPPRPAWEGALVLVGLVLVFAALEWLWVYFLLNSAWRHQLWFTILVGCVGPTITSLGFLPQIIDIVRLRSTRGISLTFIFLDIAGGVAALGSLALHAKFEVTVALMYIAVLSLEVVLLGLHVYYRTPPRATALPDQAIPFTRLQAPESAFSFHSSSALVVSPA